MISYLSDTPGSAIAIRPTPIKNPMFPIVLATVVPNLS